MTPRLSALALFGLAVACRATPDATTAALTIDRDLLDITVPALHRLYDDRKYTVTQVVEWHLERIDRYNGVYGAIETVLREDALAAAKRLDAEPGGYQDWFADPGPSPFEITLDHETQMLIEEALARVNPAFRSALVLREIEGLTYEEIAEILNVSLGTVKSRILRGRDALRKRLAERLGRSPIGHDEPSPVINFDGLETEVV